MPNILGTAGNCIPFFRDFSVVSINRGLKISRNGNNFDMIKSNKSLDEAKRYISALRGRTLDVTVNLGRNKTARYPGVLTGVYPALFTVRPSSDFRGKTSFSYSELLCGGVKIKELKPE